MPRAFLSDLDVEVLGSFPGAAEVSQSLTEILMPSATASPTTVTGAGVSQEVVEVLGNFPGWAEVSQELVEVLMVEHDPGAIGIGDPLLDFFGSTYGYST